MDKYIAGVERVLMDTKLSLNTECCAPLWGKQIQEHDYNIKWWGSAQDFVGPQRRGQSPTSFIWQGYLGGLLKEWMPESNLKYLRLYLQLDRLVRFFFHFSLVIFPSPNFRKLQILIEHISFWIENTRLNFHRWQRKAS